MIINKTFLHRKIYIRKKTNIIFCYFFCAFRTPCHAWLLMYVTDVSDDVTIDITADDVDGTDVISSVCCY